MRFEIRVPATLSNFGPGFDTLGMAVDRYLTVSVDASAGLSESAFDVSGDYAGGVPRAGDNAVFTAVKKALGVNFRMRMKNDIPLKRGLGSSSAANAAALAAAKFVELERAGALAGVDDASIAEMVRPAVYNDAIAAEGHPDNITPCLFGGFVAARIEAGEGAFMNIPCPEGMRLNLIIPEIEVETRMARKILPASYPLADVVKNLQNLACMVAEFCLSSRPQDKRPIFYNLKSLLGDRVHQSYRLSLCNPCGEVIGTLNGSEAVCGAFLSGSGTTICAMSFGDIPREISNAMHIFDAQNIPAKSFVHKIEFNGLRIRKGDL